MAVIKADPRNGGAKKELKVVGHSMHPSPSLPHLPVAFGGACGVERR